MATFAEATTIKQSSSHVYTAEFPARWCIGSVPHGGFITSCFLQVASAHFSGTLVKQNQPHTMTLHLEFLRRTQVGHATFTVRDVKLGRMTSTIHITLSQENREEVVAYISNSNLASESGATFDTRWALEPPPPPANVAAIAAGNDALWAERQELPFASFRKASSQVRFFFPAKGQLMPSLTDQWMLLRSGENFTNASLGFVADMFPMIPEICRAELDPYSIEAESKGVNTEALARQHGAAQFWYPTLLLNLDVKKALPDEGVKWLFVRNRAKQIRNGRFDLEVVIMDEAGDVVALSHHVCMILSSERNLAQRTQSVGQDSKL